VAGSTTKWKLHGTKFRTSSFSGFLHTNRRRLFSGDNGWAPSRCTATGQRPPQLAYWELKTRRKLWSDYFRLTPFCFFIKPDRHAGGLDRGAGMEQFIGAIFYEPNWSFGLSTLAKAQNDFI
jgi:hypothetical protein